MKTVYMCETCGTQYQKKSDALKCEAQKEKPVAKVGDIVSVYKHFGWFNGDKRWIQNLNVLLKGRRKCPNGDSNCFDKCCNYSFYWVITAIDNEGHKLRYHLFNRAMSGREGYTNGYTFSGSHLIPAKVKKIPKFIVRSSRSLIGKKSNHLI